MTTQYAIQSALELLGIALVLYAVWNKDKLIRLEERIWKATKRKAAQVRTHLSGRRKKIRQRTSLV